MRPTFHALPLPRQAVPTAVLALLTLGTTASGSTSSEFWTEVDVYHGIDARSRILFTADATRGSEGATENRKTTYQNGQFTFNNDYTLAPVLRTDVPESEGSKNRYLWMRVGYVYGTSFHDTDNAYRSHALIGELSSAGATRCAVPAAKRSSTREAHRALRGRAGQQVVGCRCACGGSGPGAQVLPLIQLEHDDVDDRSEPFAGRAGRPDVGWLLESARDAAHSGHCDACNRGARTGIADRRGRARRCRPRLEVRGQ